MGRHEAPLRKKGTVRCGKMSAMTAEKRYPGAGRAYRRWLVDPALERMVTEHSATLLVGPG